MEISTKSAIFWTAQSDGMVAAASISSGGSFQEILAEVIAQQGQNEVSV